MDNRNRKDDLIVDSPDLLMPLLPQSHKMANRELGIAIGILGNRTRWDGMEQSILRIKSQHLAICQLCGVNLEDN